MLPSPPLTDPDERISRIRFFTRKLRSRNGILVDVRDGSGYRASMARKRDHGRLLWRPRRASHFFHIRTSWWPGSRGPWRSAVPGPVPGGIEGENRRRLLVAGAAALLAHVLVSKYCDHLPLYRQSQIFARQGVQIDRSTLANWVGGE